VAIQGLARVTIYHHALRLRDLLKAFGIFALTLDALSIPVVDEDAQSNAALLAFAKVSCLLIVRKRGKTCQFNEVGDGNVFHGRQPSGCTRVHTL